MGAFDEGRSTWGGGLLMRLKLPGGEGGLLMRVEAPGVEGF